MTSRDEILAIFQASTGLEDIATSIDILEQYQWNLEAAVNSVLPQSFPTEPADAAMSLEETCREVSEQVVDLTTTPSPSNNNYIDITTPTPLVNQSQQQGRIVTISSSFPAHCTQQAITTFQSRAASLQYDVTPIQREVVPSQYGFELLPEPSTQCTPDDTPRQPQVVVPSSSSDDETYDDAKETLSNDDPEEEREDFDDDMFIADEEMETASTREPLIPSDCTEPVEALGYFSERFTLRYGDTHPLFFVGDLTDAVKEATGGSAEERKPMLIYLHHDRSILSNIFCSTLLCCESIVNYLSSNFLVWAWDLTMESLKRKLLDMVRDCFGIAVAKNVDDIKPDHLPVILIVYKAKGQVEVRNIIQGHIDASTMMSHLIDATEQHSVCCQIDLKEELERKAREDMILAQEQAFEESLQADREKSQQKKIEEEKKKQKEEERLRLETLVPPEPDPLCSDKVSTLRLRLPDGSMVQRRFLASLSLETVITYVGSLGYSAKDYRVLSSYPRRDVTQLDVSLSLLDLKLYPQETLFVEER